MKVLTCILITFLFILSTLTIAKEHTSEWNILSKERHGIRLHRKGKYEEAYNKLYDTAMWGLKDSQYFLGIMYLKGQFVKQDILKGMGYIGVANEADVKRRKEMFNSVYSQLSDKQKSQVDVKVKEYIVKIGLKAKSLKCTKNRDFANAGSRRIVVNCSYYKTNIAGGEIK